jgi:hypothetical protein
MTLTRLAVAFNAKSLDDLLRRVDVADLLLERGVGETTVYVLLCALEARGHDPLAWLDYEANDVTLPTRQRSTREEARRRETRRRRA